MLQIGKKNRHLLVKSFLEETRLPEKAELEIVLSDLDDDRRWADCISDNITISDRGKFHHLRGYFRHICARYDNLADKTIFLKADPFIYSTFSLQQFVDLEHNFISWYNKWGPVDNNSKLPVIQEYLQDGLPGVVIYNYGAQFAVSKELILSKPLSYYNRLLTLCESRPFLLDYSFNSAMEMLCPFIFGVNPADNMWWQEYCPLPYNGP